MNDDFIVNGLALPPLFISLLQQGKWQHPGHARLLDVIPFLREKMEFISSIEAMRFGMKGTLELIDDPIFPFLSERWHYAPGSRSVGPLELPWLDLEKAVDIAVALERGGDIAITLDYRTSLTDPRVVINEWTQEGGWWREVTPTFSEFVERLGLTTGGI
jgi:hypothetical protein